MAAVMPEDRSIDESIHALDARLHRVEQAVAALSDTQLMEDRIVERVAHRTDPHQNGGLLAGAAKLFKSGARQAGRGADRTTAATRADCRAAAG